MWGDGAGERDEERGAGTRGEPEFFLGEGRAGVHGDGGKSIFFHDICNYHEKEEEGFIIVVGIKEIELLKLS